MKSMLSAFKGTAIAPATVGESVLDKHVELKVKDHLPHAGETAPVVATPEDLRAGALRQQLCNFLQADERVRLESLSGGVIHAESGTKDVHGGLLDRHKHANEHAVETQQSQLQSPQTSSLSNFGSLSNHSNSSGGGVDDEYLRILQQQTEEQSLSVTVSIPDVPAPTEQVISEIVNSATQPKEGLYLDPRDKRLRRSLIHKGRQPASQNPKPKTLRGTFRRVLNGVQARMVGMQRLGMGA